MFDPSVEDSAKKNLALACLVGQTSINLLISLQRAEPVKGPGLLDPPFELEMDNQLILTAEELHEQLHKDVEDVGFVNVANHVAKQGPLGVEDRQ